MSGFLTGLVWHWGDVPTTSYRCGWCDRQVASTAGGAARSSSVRSGIIHEEIRVLVCPGCNGPTFLDPFNQIQVPGVPLAQAVPNLPKDVELVYNEARRSATVGAYTAAALCSRKLLMHVAVDKGADPGQSFQSYVDFLLQKSLVPANAKTWIDSIRANGNEATHQIKVVTPVEAEQLLAFTQMLLQLVYDFPKRMMQKP